MSTPNPEAFQTLSARSEVGPVTMLNLLAFKPDGGRESYMAYGIAVRPLLEAAGGEVIFAGSGHELLIGGEADGWDIVLLVRYPTRGAFMGMVMSEAYRKIQHLREDALERSVLLAVDGAHLGDIGVRD